MSQLPFLNLGCGITFDPRWTNIDFVSTGEGVLAHNLLKGIPEKDNSFEVVYHSHMLEHFPKKSAVTLMKECYRVLKPGGILRVAIPDLEQIALNYIKYLNEAVEGKNKAKEKYEWSLIELLDQMVRNKTGGEMLEYVADTSKDNDEFILQRCGKEIERLMEVTRGKKTENNSISKVKTPSVFSRAKNKVKRESKKKILGDEYELLEMGRFRTSGEIHQWMYDRFSLGELMKNCGFKNVSKKTAFESDIANWESFKLDGENGVVRKPDSLFMEGIK